MRVQLWQAGMAIALAGASANAQIRITQSIEPDFVDPGSVACAAANPQRTTENSYYRTFDLTQFPVVTGPFHITSLEVGVERAAFPAPIPPGEQDVTVNLWVDCNGGAPLVGDLTLIGTSIFTMLDGALFIEIIPVDAVVCNDATLVVEVNTPSYTAQTENAVFFMGSNAFGQNSPSYIRASSCAITEITDIAAIGFPDMHIVLNVLGEIVAQCDDPCAPSCPACACEFDTSTGPGVCDIVDFTIFAGLFAGNDPCACDLDTSTGPGICDIVDFTTFAGQFAGGCP